METSTKILIPNPKSFKVLNLFAYSTHGVPGIEIIGLGKYSKMLKEKLYFICRSRRIKLPLKKFVLCLEACDELKRLNWSYLQWSELSYFLLLLNMAGQLPISRLEHCLSFGKIESNGEITQFLIPETINEYCQKNHLSLIYNQTNREGKSISLTELLSEIPYLDFRSQEFWRE